MIHNDLIEYITSLSREAFSNAGAHALFETPR